MIIADVRLKIHVRTVVEPQNTIAIGITGVKMTITMKNRPRIIKNEIATITTIITKVATIIQTRSRAMAMVRQRTVMWKMVPKRITTSRQAKRTKNMNRKIANETMENQIEMVNRMALKSIRWIVRNVRSWVAKSMLVDSNAWCAMTLSSRTVRCGRVRIAFTSCTWTASWNGPNLRNPKRAGDAVRVRTSPNPFLVNTSASVVN